MVSQSPYLPWLTVLSHCGHTFHQFRLCATNKKATRNCEYTTGGPRVFYLLPEAKVSVEDHNTDNRETGSNRHKGNGEGAAAQGKLRREATPTVQPSHALVGALLAPPSQAVRTR